MSKKVNTNYAKAIGVIFILISVFIGFKIYRNINRRQFPKPRETDISLIQSWMTLDYISKTYGIPMPEIKQNLGYKFENGKISIDKISKDNNIESSEAVTKIQNIITDFQKNHQKPPQQ